MKKNLCIALRFSFKSVWNEAQRVDSNSKLLQQKYIHQTERVNHGRASLGNELENYADNFSAQFTTLCVYII